MKLLNSKNLKLRNKTFDWTSKVRNLLKLRAKTQKNMWGLLVQQQKLKNHIKLTRKLEMPEQDTTKTSLLTLSGSKISIRDLKIPWTRPKRTATGSKLARS